MSTERGIDLDLRAAPRRPDLVDFDTLTAAWQRALDAAEHARHASLAAERREVTALLASCRADLLAEARSLRETKP